MDEADLIDWYDVVEAAANGQLAGQACPKCGQRRLATRHQGGWMSVRCADCGEGFEGRLGHGRDDAFQAEAAELMRQQAARAAAKAQASATATTTASTPGTSATGQGTTLAATVALAPPAEPAPQVIRREEPWTWSLPAEGGQDLDGLSLWMDVVQSVHNGRRTGLNCPLCSEPLDDITVRDPFVRIRCRHCNEGFEGRIG